MHRVVTDLYPICRSITGDGFRQTLRYLQQHVPLEVREVPSGTRVLDWEIPKEWNIRDAYIKNSMGERVVDFQKCNLHVLHYSAPIHKTMRRTELKERIFTLPEHPDWIPYRTSYYSENWGFCLSHNQWLAMQEEEYEVCIDSTLAAGHLTYGELVLPGRSTDEVLLSCHACHPSLANDNLSGITIALQLARQMASQSLRYTYRFLWIPVTIGSITWLARNETVLPRIKHGLVLTCLGDAGHVTYKRSRVGTAEVDRAVEHVLRRSGQPFEIVDFIPWGYDERQYCSPGFNLPVGCMMRTPNGKFPEYHTSADNPTFVKPEFLAESLATLQQVLAVLEANGRYLNLSPKGEPQLGKRGLYRKSSGQRDAGSREMALLWVLNFSDGLHTLLDIAERSGIDMPALHQAALELIQCGLLKEL